MFGKRQNKAVGLVVKGTVGTVVRANSRANLPAGAIFCGNWPVTRLELRLLKSIPFVVPKLNELYANKLGVKLTKLVVE